MNPLQLANESGQTVNSGARPLIAVTTSEIREHRWALTPHGEPPQHEMALGLKYMRAIEAAGGIPVVLPPLATEALAPLLSQVSGVCLSGGPDLDPATYGQIRHELTGPVWEELDRFELGLARAADAYGLPILAICRGMQVLNVSRGGTLHQHLPDIAGERICHRQPEVSAKPTHRVTIEESSRLREILGARRKMVNSFHHQAVASLGERLRITATASDGTIEAVEAIDRDFVLGVQWHAECLVGGREHAALFSAFVAAAMRYSQSETPLVRAV
ncbi:MAG TPA: gamma-glutamyl-gamma-aminobutyrate hydrolase family protein [Solirubrobacteraceae bacterium]|nr:gamma-glutamyl-gamma-aminobutyrate hydrolase family protein [Solirubrobacteraceae bacterium]